MVYVGMIQGKSGCDVKIEMISKYELKAGLRHMTASKATSFTACRISSNRCLSSNNADIVRNERFCKKKKPPKKNYYRSMGQR